MTRRRLGEFFGHLRHYPGRQKLVAMYEAYFDASRTGERRRLTDVITLACLVAPARVWLRFSDAWNAAMQRGGAEGKILHMREIVHGAGEWTGWDDAEKQARLFRKLVPVCCKHIAHGFCLGYPTFWWNQTSMIISSKPATPLLELFQATMDGMMTVIKPTEKEPVHSFMEADQLVEHDITRHFYYLARARGWERIFPSITPLPKGPAPLQAADMIAYEGSRFVSEHAQTRSKRAPRRLYTELRRIRQLHFRHMHLGDYIRLATASTLAGEQIRRAPEIKAALDAAFAAAGRQTQRERSAQGRARKKKARERKE